MQLVMLTFDDSITPDLYQVIKPILDANLVNPNGCRARFTFFPAFDWDEPCASLATLASRGHEIASHTCNHTHFAQRDEIDCGRNLASQCSGLPKSQVVGFRPPYLESDYSLYDALYQLGFNYTSSLEESYVNTGNTFTARVWPYSLDNGFAGGYYPGHRWPGLWSIPLNALWDNGEPAYVMEPEAPDSQFERLYMDNFLATYNGNRAPFGIWVHAWWLQENSGRVPFFVQLLQRLLTYPDVWVVSMSDVIRYVKAPVPAGSLNPPFVCRP